MKKVEPDSVLTSDSILNVDVIVEAPEWNFLELDLNIYIKHVVQYTLRYLGHLQFLNQIDLTVLLADDETLHRLNKEFKQQNKPTNVLSFPYTDLKPGFIQNESKVFLGDIAISYQRLYSESIEQAKTFKAHLTHLLVHSVLHLLGYDHEQANDAEIMEPLEVIILYNLGFDNPYVIEQLNYNVVL